MNGLDISVKCEVRPSTKTSGLEMAWWRVMRRGRLKKIRIVTNMMAGQTADGQQIKGRKPRAEKG